jgi:hypothetical protein
VTFLDPGTEELKKLDARMPFIVPKRFYVKQVQKGEAFEQRLMVDVIKKGQQNPTVTPYIWAQLERNPENEIYQVLKPYYEKWKDGQTAPVNGLPLDAWLADPELIEALAKVQIRTVEDLAKLADSDLVKIGIPGLRDKQKNARTFLEARQSTAPMAAELAKARQDNERQALEIAELRAAVNQLVADRDTADNDVPRRGPGRPRKNPEPEAA